IYGGSATTTGRPSGRPSPTSSMDARTPSFSQARNSSDTRSKSDGFRLLLLLPLCHPLLILLGWDIFDVGGNAPLVPERISQGAHAVAPEVVLDGHLFGPAGVDRLLKSAIHVVGVDDQADAGPAARLGSEIVALGEFVVEHDPRVADLELGVPDLVAHRQPRNLRGAQL